MSSSEKNKVKQLKATPEQREKAMKRADENLRIEREKLRLAGWRERGIRRRQDGQTNDSR